MDANLEVESGSGVGDETWDSVSSGVPSSPLASSASAVIARGRRRRERDRTVAIFWDIENLQVPSYMDAASLGMALQDLARGLSPREDVAFFNAYIDTSRLGTLNANRLSQTGVSLIHSPTAKEAADKAIIVDLLLWILIFERNNMFMNVQGIEAPEPCVVLITQDHDFEPMLYKLRNQRGIHVVLITDFERVQPHFLNSADEAFDWREILAEVQPLESRLSSSPQSSFKSLDSDFGSRRGSWGGPSSDREDLASTASFTPGQQQQQQQQLQPPPSPKSRPRSLDSSNGMMNLTSGSSRDRSASASVGRNDKENSDMGANARQQERQKLSKQGQQQSVQSKGAQPPPGMEPHGMKKRYSSVQCTMPHYTLRDEIADFALRILKAKGKLTADVLLSLMKNPATGGTADMYHLASQDYGKRIETILEKYPDRFELSFNKRSQKTWVKLIGDSHTLLCEELAVSAPHYTEKGPLKDQVPIPTLVSCNSTQHDEPEHRETPESLRSAVSEEGVPRMRRSPSNWDIALGDALEDDSDA